MNRVHRTSIISNLAEEVNRLEKRREEINSNIKALEVEEKQVEIELENLMGAIDLITATKEGV